MDIDEIIEAISELDIDEKKELIEHLDIYISFEGCFGSHPRKIEIQDDGAILLIQ